MHIPVAHHPSLCLRATLLLGLVAVMLVPTTCLQAAEPAAPAKPTSPKKDESSLDDALLKDLDNELLEGAGDLKGKAKPKPAAQKPAGDKSPSEGDAAPGEDIGMPSEDDPLVRISREMRSAESLIPESARHADAEQLQQQIVTQLNKLVEQAERQSSQQQSSSKKSQQKSNRRQSVKQPQQGAPGGSGKESNKPADDSTERLGKSEAARPDPELMRGLMKDSWGHLPQHAREQMLQNSPERFLPQYELMIERYYKRLAEENRAK